MAETSTTTSSSDSELESCIRISKKQKTTLCLICQKYQGILIQGSDQTFKTLKLSLKLRENATKVPNLELNEAIKAVEMGNTDLLVWHKNCYSSFTSKKNIQILQRKADQQIESNITCEQGSLGPILRKEVFDVKKCVFCQKRSNVMKLSQVLTTNIENKIKLISKANVAIMKRVGTNDLIAMEVKYHVQCFLASWSKTKKTLHATSSHDEVTNESNKCTRENAARNMLYKELEKGFAKGKGFSSTSIYNRYAELGGEISKRQLMKVIKNYFGSTITNVQSKKANESDIIMPSTVSKDAALRTYMEKTDDADTTPIFSGSSEFSTIHKIVNDIKQEMDKIPTFDSFQNLDISNFKKYIPDTLVWLVTLLVSHKAGDVNEVRILSLCQDIIFTYSKTKMTPKHVGLGIMVHQQTKSKKLIEVLHQCGHSVSYKDVLRIRNTIAQDEIRKYINNDFTFIPSQLVPQRLIQFAADNIDILEETLDKSPTFHATQMAAFQQGPANTENEDHIFRLLPYKAKLDIPDNFHFLRHVNLNPTTKPLPLIKNKRNIFEIQLDTNWMRCHNMSWVLCRTVNKSFEDIIVPQWSGFHKLLTAVDSDVTSYGYLPLLPYVSSDYDTIWTVLTRCKNIAQFLNIRHTIVTFDQALYHKAKEIVWLQKEECCNFIIRMGGFHIMLNFLKVIGQYMENSGLKDVWLESGLYGETTILGIFAGKKWNKGIRAHKLTYESLLRILLSLFEVWLTNSKSDDIHTLNLAKLTALELCNNIQNAKNCDKEFKSITSLLQKCSDTFNEFVDAQSPTFKYWMNYLELVEILLEFLYSERSKNWLMQLRSLKRMLPWFFAFDHTNYARWASVYIIDMLNLPNDAPEVYDEFCRGNFVVKRLPGSFNTISVDQALEHINRTSKDAGGIVGLTKNSTRLDEWFISFNEIGLMVDKFVTSLKLKTDSDSQNIETGPQRMMVDEKSVLDLQAQFSQFKVFTHDEDNLLCISTNIIFSEGTKHSILNAPNIGEDALKKFIEIIDTSDFYKPLKKMSIMKLKNETTKRHREEKKNSYMHGQETIQRILAVSEMGRKIDFQEIFKHELTAYPMSLAANNMLSTPSNKSALGGILETYTTEISNTFENSEGKKLCHIFDGMSVVQKIGKPTNAKTFGDYARIFSQIIFSNKHKANRIDLVMDHYHELSIKNCTRIKRGTGAAIKRLIDSGDMPLPQQWNLFINSVFNKNQLTNFLSRQLIEYSRGKPVEFVTSGGFSDIRQYESNFSLEDFLLTSNHEEADTRILLHILSAKNAGYDKCIIECNDTDVMVLLVHFKSFLIPEMWMKIGIKGNIRFIPIHNVDLEPHLLKNLPSFHALTGCDTTSQFSGFGKKTCWKTYLTFHELLDDLGLRFDQEIFKNIEKFVLRLYTPNQDIISINQLRGLRASSKTIDKLPPTEDSLYQHCLRAHYQCHIWLNALQPILDLPNYLEYGWQLSDSKVVPVLQTIPPFPQAMPFFTTCGCKKDCKSQICCCKKNKVTCIGSCRCMGQSSCLNKTPSSSSVVQKSTTVFEEESDSE